MYNALVKASFWTPFDWRLRAITWLRIVSIILGLIHFGIGLALVITGNYTMTAFTFWSFTMLGVFHVALVISLFVGRLPFTITTMGGIPWIIGVVWGVCLGIIAFILDNSELLTDNSTCDPSAPADARTMGLTNAGNWIEHGWPVLDVVLILLAGGEYFSRYIIVRTLTAWSSFERLMYYLYFMLCPFFMIIIFEIVFGFGDTYPTSFSWWARFGIAVGAILPCQKFLWMSLTTITKLTQVDPFWIPSARNRCGPALFQEDKASYDGEALRLEAEMADRPLTEEEQMQFI